MKNILILFIILIATKLYATNFILNNSGNVGISSANPTDKLCIDGGNLKITNGNISSDSVYLMVFSSQASAGVTLETQSKWYNVPGTTVTFTVTVPSIAIVTATWDLQCGSDYGAILLGELMLDSQIVGAQAVLYEDKGQRATLTQNYILSLTVGKHNTTMEAQKFSSASVTPICNSGHTNYCMFIFKQ